MPLFDDQDKTEPATPRKRSEARQSGSVAKSNDLNIAVLLLAIFACVAFFGLTSMGKISAMMRDLIGRMALADTSPGGLVRIFADSVIWIVRVVAPFAAVAAAVGFLTNFFQVGPLFTGQPLKPEISKLNPLQGLGRIFSLKGVAKTLFGVLKVSAVGFVLVWTLWEELSRTDGQNLLLLLQAAWPDVVGYTVAVVTKMGLRAVAVFLVLALFDFFYQKWQFEKDLMMTKQEVREEMLRLEGDPKVKERRKRIQQQLVTQKMMRDVPGADVVVTNPTHYAVAIRYERASMAAPRCVAKGQDHLAQRIREVAMEHGVPVVERPELARALHATVEVGEEVPQELYRAVAEVLAYVYRLSGPRSRRSAGGRRAAPRSGMQATSR